MGITLKTKLFFALTLGLICPVSTQAAEIVDHTFSVKALGGLALFNKFGSHFGFGGAFDYRFNPRWSLGTTFLTASMGAFSSNRSATIGNQRVTCPQTESIHPSTYNLHVRYTIPNASGLWIGVQTGATAFSNQVKVTGALSTNYSTTKVARNFGPSIGLDYMVTDDISLGMELNYLFTAARYVGPTTSTKIGIFYALAAVGYHF